jgi:hypothetical protein
MLFESMILRHKISQTTRSDKIICLWQKNPDSPEFR